MADLSSILGGMVQGFKDFGTGLVDFFGTGAANIGDIASSIATGRATTKNQDDFRKWLYQTDDKQDAAAKGLGTILNGVSTVADVMPGAQAVTANPLFNGLQGAIGGVSDELKMAGKDADWGRAAQRAGVGAASGLASGYAGQALGKSGNKLLSNGLTRGAVSGALGGGIANAGYTGIEGGSVQDMINAGLYGAQTGALVGGTTGLARELMKPNYKMDVALTDDEKAARIANIDDQLGKLDLSTPEGNERYNELTQARQEYNGSKPKTVADLMNEPKQKTVADLMLSPDDEVMAAKVAPGQLDLFSQPKQKTAPKQKAPADEEQLNLFSQPKPVEPENPYAPVDGKVTDKMRDRATDIMGNWKKNGVPENELYSAINQDTIPDKIKTLKDVVDGGAYEKRMRELFGTTDIKKADIGKIVDYIYNTEPARAENIKNNLLAERSLDKYAQKTQNRLKKSLYEVAQERIADDIGANGLASSKNIADISIRRGYTAAADEALSERLGIAPGNTPKYNGAIDTRNVLGRYAHPTYGEGGDLAVFESKMSSPEDAISTVAHERLHSFQGELESRNKGRYDKEILEAYEQLRRDLAPHYKSWDETAERYGHRNTGYWQTGGEQESRMLQNYLENKGYTDSPHMKNKYRVGEWGNEINPAFDKFFDKLRALSKKGVALPALSALFGGGAIMAATQGDDKKKKSEVK